jgi:tRNA threonylcarbamoyladenosine biosynthesis protein TsaB
MNAVLALDTSTDYCSVAFADNDVSRSVSESLPRAHNQHILAMVDEVLAECMLKDHVDVIACGVGPGSFTGLRVAVGVAQGLAWSLDLPIWPFCSLRAQALSDATRKESDYVLSLIDAQIGQVYGAWFQWRGNELHCISEPAIRVIEDFVADPLVLLAEAYAVGDGVLAMSEQDRGAFAGIFPDLRPNVEAAAQLCRLEANDTNLVLAAQLEPRYVQQDIGWKKLSEQGVRR